MKTLDEFKTAGGALTGGTHSSHEEYKGPPRPYNDKLSTTFENLEEKFESHHHTGLHGEHNTTGMTGATGVGHQSTSGTTGGFMDNKSHRPTDSGYGGNDFSSSGGLREGQRGVGNEYGSSGLGRESRHGIGSENDRHLGQRGQGPMGTTEPLGSSTSGNKPTMSDRMNPRVDADRDGKAGVMD